jgi:hypothetical protein
MTAGKIFPNRDRVLAVLAAETRRCKTEHRMSTQAVAEAFGKQDRKSAVALLLGQSDPGLAGIIEAASDPRFGPAFLNGLLSNLLGIHVLAPEDDAGGKLDSLAIGVSTFLTTFLQFYANRNLDHQQMLALAKLLRPMLPELNSIVASADRIAA